MFSFIQLQTDTIANASNVVVEKIAAPQNEISMFGFIMKGGVFLIPIAILLFYTIYVIFERYISFILFFDFQLLCQSLYSCHFKNL